MGYDDSLMPRRLAYQWMFDMKTCEHNQTCKRIVALSHIVFALSAINVRV